MAHIYIVRSDLTSSTCEREFCSFVCMHADLRNCDWYNWPAYQICISFDGVVISCDYNITIVSCVYVCVQIRYIYISVRHWLHSEKIQRLYAKLFKILNKQYGINK